MKKYTRFFVFSLVLFFIAVTVFAQVGFTGPYGYMGQPGVSGQYGYTGPVQVVTVAQAQGFSHKSQVIVRGNIVQAIGGDNYMFRDASGDILLKIGPKEWMNFGTTISPTDTIEISGELHRKDWWKQPEIHARFIRKI